MSVSFIQTGGLLTVLSTDRTLYAPGEPIRISLFKLNISARPIILTYPTSQRYDFNAVGFMGEIWRWSADQVFLPVVEQITLAPGQSLAYVETWAQVDNFGRRVPPGFYRLTGWNTTEGFLTLPRPSVFVRIGF